MSKNFTKNNESLTEELVHINRVTKVVKGGRNFSFSVVVVVGNENGKVGYGKGKAKEVIEAKAKAAKHAKKNLLSVSLYENRTIHHDIIGKSGAAKVILRKASPGTGVIAGGAMRSIFGRLGVVDIVAKSLGSSTSNSLIMATFDALKKISTPQEIANRRGKTIEQLK